jgi:hypothetical protein
MVCPPVENDRKASVGAAAGLRLPQNAHVTATINNISVYVFIAKGIHPSIIPSFSLHDPLPEPSPGRKDVKTHI